MTLVINLETDPYISFARLYLPLTEFFNQSSLNQIKFVDSDVSIFGIERFDKTIRSSKQSDKNIFISDI